MHTVYKIYVMHTKTRLISSLLVFSQVICFSHAIIDESLVLKHILEFAQFSFTPSVQIMVQQDLHYQLSATQSNEHTKVGSRINLKQTHEVGIIDENLFYSR